MISRGNTEKTKIRRKINRKSGKIWVTFYYYLLRRNKLKVIKFIKFIPPEAGHPSEEKRRWKKERNGNSR